MQSLLVKSSLMAAAMTLSACGGGGGGTPTSPSTPNPITINVTGQAGSLSFSPNPASAGGQMTVFRNNDTIVHRVVLNDGTIDTGDIAAGATSRAVQMPRDGTNYHCSIHPTMIGSVNAQSGGQPPPCVGAYCD
jgi:plastocyanin